MSYFDDEATDEVAKSVVRSERLRVHPRPTESSRFQRIGDVVCLRNACGVLARYRVMKDGGVRRIKEKCKPTAALLPQFRSAVHPTATPNSGTLPVLTEPVQSPAVPVIHEPVHAPPRPHRTPGLPCPLPQAIQGRRIQEAGRTGHPKDPTPSPP